MRLLRTAYTEARCCALMALLRTALYAVLELAHCFAEQRVLRDIARCAERWTETLLFLIAIDRARPVAPSRIGRASFAPPGFRRLRFNARALIRLSRVRGASLPALQRLRRLFALLADPETAIARVVRRLPYGGAPVRLAAVSPRPLMLVASMCVAAPNGADTS